MSKLDFTHVINIYNIKFKKKKTLTITILVSIQIIDDVANFNPLISKWMTKILGTP